MESRLLGFPVVEYRRLALHGGSWAREPSCSNTGTINGQYKKNLDELLSNLSKAETKNGVFRTSTVGTGADQVRGSLMCFVDHDQTKCLDCLAKTTAWITRTCPNSRTASASYSACLLQYSSPPFFDFAKHSYSSVMNITFMSFPPPPDGNMASMANARSRLFEDISRKASNQTLGFYNQIRRYTAGKQMMRVYGLAQCSGDLAPGGCSRCISGYNGMLQRLFPNNDGGIVKGHSCYVRFQPSEINIFAEPMPPPSASRDPVLMLLPPYSPPQGPFLPPPPSYSHRRGQDSALIAMTVVMVAVLTLCMTAALIWWRCWRKAKAYFFPNLIGNLDTGGKKFSYRELVTATQSFSTKLGQGGFGAVYKGKIGDLMVAIKKLSNVSTKRSRDAYRAEVATLTHLRHRNVVQLIGWCHHKKYLLLVYELIPKGSLDTHLNPNKPVLPWSYRYEIAQDLAHALAYIHEDSNDSRLVIHKDIKPENIMIGESFEAKLGDFGLAIFVKHGQSVDTEKISGTVGYVDPFSNGKLCPMSDMYSFGVVLLMMGSGRLVIEEVKDVQGNVDKIHVKDSVLTDYGNGGAKAVADPRLGEYLVMKEMDAMIRVGLLCVSKESKKRPSAKEVIQWLKPPLVSEDTRDPRHGSSVSGFLNYLLPDTNDINSDRSTDAVNGDVLSPDSINEGMSSVFMGSHSRIDASEPNSNGSTKAVNEDVLLPDSSEGTMSSTLLNSPSPHLDNLNTDGFTGTLNDVVLLSDSSDGAMSSSLLNSLSHMDNLNSDGSREALNGAVLLPDSSDGAMFSSLADTSGFYSHGSTTGLNSDGFQQVQRRQRKHDLSAKAMAEGGSNSESQTKVDLVNRFLEKKKQMLGKND